MKTRHQPPSAKSSGAMSDVMRRPRVGTSQSRPTTTRRTWIGAFPRTRSTLADFGSSTTRTRGSGRWRSRWSRFSPEVADVEQEDRDHKDEEEDRDRRAKAEVVAPPKDVLHMASAITFASSCTEPGASETTMSKTLSTLISIVTKTTESTGRSCGTVTRRKTCHSLAPSVRAASRRLGGSPRAPRRSRPSRTRPRSRCRRSGARV